MKKAIITTGLGVFLTCFYLGLYISSLTFDSGISAESSYVIALVIGVTIFVTGLVAIFKTKKNESTFNTYILGFGIVALFFAFVPLGNMFDQIASKEATEVIVKSFILFGIGAFSLAYIVVLYLENKRK